MLGIWNVWHEIELRVVVRMRVVAGADVYACVMIAGADEVIEVRLFDILRAV